MSGAGGMGDRMPPADTTETEERDEDKIIHKPLKWSQVNKHEAYDVEKNKRLPVSNVGADKKPKVQESFEIKINDSKVFYK
jgi:hypothetical protein